jgi:hypothetical protein
MAFRHQVMLYGILPIERWGRGLFTDTFVMIIAPVSPRCLDSLLVLYHLGRNRQLFQEAHRNDCKK